MISIKLLNDVDPFCFCYFLSIQPYLAMYFFALKQKLGQREIVNAIFAKMTILQRQK
jgi:hypothetical protein